MMQAVLAYGWIRPRLAGDYRHPRYGYDLRRQELDPMLRELAVETPGVQLMLGQDVTGLVRSNGRPAGVRVVDRERRERDVTARVVVGADGRDSGGRATGGRACRWPAAPGRSRIEQGGRRRAGRAGFVSWPAESAAAVVFVHGNPGSRRDWDDLLSRVAPFSRVLALDMPGFGRADKPGDFTYTVEGD